jgi:hypothetical protein
LRLVSAIGLPKATLPQLIKETRKALQRDWGHERLVEGPGKSLGKNEKQTDRAGETNMALPVDLRDVQRKMRAYETRLGGLERQAEADRRQLARFESLLTQDDAADAETLAHIDLQRIAKHLQDRLAAVSISNEPFPHMIVDDLLPANFYELLVDAIHPAVFFSGEKKSKQDFRPNARLAPPRTKSIWGYMDQQVCPRVLMPILLERFRPQLDAHLRTLFGEEALDRARELPMTTFEGRIMRRRPGYSLGPHQDPMRFFLTALLYLSGSSGDDARWGTQLFAADRDFTVSVRNIFYAESEGIRCTLAKTAPYRRNSLLVFLNHRSLHGAEISPESAPPDLERFAFQFYIGPETGALRELLPSLPAERRSMWRTRHEAESGDRV